MPIKTILDSWPQVTMILFSTSDEDTLPTLRQACKALEVAEARYYVGRSRLRRVLEVLTDLQNILNKHADMPTGEPALNCDQLLVTQGYAKPNMFFALRHSNSVMGGFELNKGCIAELSKAIDFFRHSVVMKDRPNDISDSVLDDRAYLIDRQCVDRAVEQLNLAAITDLMQGYGEATYTAALQRLKDWFHAHRWNLVSGNGSEEQQHVDATPTDTVPSHA